MHCVLHTVHCTVDTQIKNTTYNKKRLLLLLSILGVRYHLHPVIVVIVII